MAPGERETLKYLTFTPSSISPQGFYNFLLRFTVVVFAGEFPTLQNKMRAILRIEVEAVRFLKEEPHKLDSLLKRVRSMTDILTMLRRWLLFFSSKINNFLKQGWNSFQIWFLPLSLGSFEQCKLLAVFYRFFLESSQGESNYPFLCFVQWFCSDQQPHLLRSSDWR